MVVDHQWHWVPAELLELLRARETPPRADERDDGWAVEFADRYEIPMPPGLVDLDDQLQMAAEHGVDVVVASPIVLGEVMHLEAAEAADLLERANAAIAKAQRDHPEHFVGLALLPLQDAGAALEVLDKAVADGLTGVSMLASIDGRPLATEATGPIFRRIDELGLPIVLHPAIRSSTYTQGLGRHAELGLGWMYHTALAALNLIQSGTLDECPGLKILHPHLGGALPYVLGRIARMPGEERDLPSFLRRHFYVDIVGATPGALDIAIDTYGLDHVLFGTDYPWVPVGAAFHYLESATPEVRTAILENRLPGLKGPAGVQS